uniref:AlNc14C48G3811 protein n=1 Tax=Albugo laibachii Nc14 TaxID=890382 RepID=F0WAU9_9STRA|nr:AlNc14C48G3811 [Albugo laibachii Nc14]|eukprot:CCA18271.1 AlNc14C48G3811 [Albugo laibachii Nc14]
MSPSAADNEILGDNNYFYWEFNARKSLLQFIDGPVDIKHHDQSAVSDNDTECDIDSAIVDNFEGVFCLEKPAQPSANKSTRGLRSDRTNTGVHAWNRSYECKGDSSTGMGTHAKSGIQRNGTTSDKRKDLQGRNINDILELLEKNSAGSVSSVESVDTGRMNDGQDFCKFIV